MSTKQRDLKEKLAQQSGSKWALQRESVAAQNKRWRMSRRQAASYHCHSESDDYSYIMMWDDGSTLIRDDWTVTNDYQIPNCSVFTTFYQFSIFKLHQWSLYEYLSESEQISFSLNAWEIAFDALISSGLGYCNALYYGTDHSVVQLVQNAAARLLTNTPKCCAAFSSPALDPLQDPL